MSTDTFAKTYQLLAGTGLSDVWWKTGRLTIKASRAETGGSLAQFETNDPPGTATPLHIHHNEDETFYVLEGEVSLLVDGERNDLSAASAYVPARRRTPMSFARNAPDAHHPRPAGLEEVSSRSGPRRRHQPARKVQTDRRVVRRFGAYGCEVVGPPPTLAGLGPLGHEGYGNTSQTDPSHGVEDATDTHLVELSIPPKEILMRLNRQPFGPRYGDAGRRGNFMIARFGSIARGLVARAEELQVTMVGAHGGSALGAGRLVGAASAVSASPASAASPSSRHAPAIP